MLPIVTVYFERKDRDDDKLAYADRVGNGAVFKRLGFLAERGSDTTTLVEACRARLTKGNAKLDTRLSCRRLISRWRLLMPESWAKAASPD